jgi:hypothetical protein
MGGVPLDTDLLIYFRTYDTSITPSPSKASEFYTKMVVQVTDKEEFDFHVRVRGIADKTLDDLHRVLGICGIVEDSSDLKRLSYLEVVTYRPMLSSDVPLFINWKYLSSEFRVDCFGG